MTKDKAGQVTEADHEALRERVGILAYRLDEVESFTAQEFATLRAEMAAQVAAEVTRQMTAAMKGMAEALRAGLAEGADQ